MNVFIRFLFFWTFLKVFGRVRTCSDAFGHIRMRSDAFRCVGRRLDTSGNFRIFEKKSDDFDDCCTLGANYNDKIRVQGLIISGAKYSAPP